MNNNEESLIKHALKLYELQYDDNIELVYYKNYNYIEVRRRKLQNYSVILHLYNENNETFGIDFPIYKSSNISSNLNINICSFINHWIQYFNVNKKINRVAVLECFDNALDIAILCNDNCWHYVLCNPRPWVGDWIIYNW